MPVSLAGGRVSVRLSGTFALVQTDFGLWVRFDGNHHAEVSAPSSYAGRLCGLCGEWGGGQEAPWAGGWERGGCAGGAQVLLTRAACVQGQEPQPRTRATAPATAEEVSGLPCRPR